MTHTQPAGVTKLKAHERFATDSLRRILFLDADAGLKLASECFALARFRMGKGPIFVRRVPIKEIQEIRRRPSLADPPTSWLLAQRDACHEAVAQELVDLVLSPGGNTGASSSPGGNGA